ncbi:hypothetical protein AB1484_27210 [Parafrankia sp. FMc6]|uniref:hypothetical protein n=1 Tax=Parafrankia soli TaxID=2599596 RepID=UPI0034D3B771
MPTFEPDRRREHRVEILADEIPAGLTVTALNAALDAMADIGIMAEASVITPQQWADHLAAAEAAIAERTQLRARVAELEIAVEPDGARRLELAKKLAISAGNLLRIERDDARARADAAEKRVAELEWIESTSCCGVEANQYGVRARKAEAAIREALAVLEPGPCDCEGQAAEIAEAIRILREAAATPAAEPDSPAG